MSALSYGQVAGANNRVRVGFIGCGNRGRSVASRMKQAPDTEFVAHADVYDRNAGIAKDSEWSQPDADIYKDFRDILDRDDVDAVLIGTPDHWHAIPTVLACQAGKDVYVEKPLAHNIVEGRAMVNAARDNERIVQTGTQHRSAPHYMEVAQMVREGDLGEIRYVRVWNYRGGGGGGGRRGGRGGGGGRGGRRGGGGGGGRGGGRGRGRGVELDSNGIPVGLDWDFYVGPAPMVPFSRERWPVFRGWFDFAGGFVTDFGTHRFDSMRQLMGEADPISASASGIASDGSGGDTPAIVQATLGFPGFVMSYEAITGNSTGNGFTTPGLRNYQGGDNRRPHGIALYGTQGTIFIDRIGYDVYPAGGGGGFGRGRGRGGQESDAASEEIPVTQLGDVPDLPPESERLVRRGVQSDDRTDLHTINFIECVRSRELPNADVEIGQRSTSVGHLINIAYRSGKKFTFDPETESIPDAPEAAALLTRKAREPWDIIPGT